MINRVEQEKAYNSIKGWKLVSYFSVGGFEWLGFSKIEPFQMLCISSQKTTMVNCQTGMITECDTDYDEENRIAVCNLLPEEEILLAGQYGGELPSFSNKGEKTVVEAPEPYIKKITFITQDSAEILIYCNYGYYTCGFSYDGNYFVLADDGGIAVLKRVG